MDIQEARVYIGSRFLLTDFKREKKRILGANGVLRSYDVSSSWNDVLIKTYFDTPDEFFYKKGLYISINSSNKKSRAKLVVSVDDDVRRIKFLRNMPNIFIKEISKGSGILSHIDFITAALSMLYPMGLNIDVPAKLKELNMYVMCVKHREIIKAVSLKGLKISMSFESCIYSSATTDSKVYPRMLSVRLESLPSKTKEEYAKFEKELMLQVPTILKQPYNELFVAKKRLL